MRPAQKGNIAEWLFLASLVVLCVGSTSVSHAATVWDGVVELDGKVEISKGDTLIIQPGCHVKISNGWESQLIVRGVLIANGKADNLIIFDVGNPKQYWGGIHILGPRVGRETAASYEIRKIIVDEPTESSISFCEIINGRPQAIFCCQSSPQIENNRILHTNYGNVRGVLCEHGASPKIESNTIEYRGKNRQTVLRSAGVLSLESNPNVSGNHFVNYSVGVQHRARDKMKPRVGNNEIVNGEVVLIVEGDDNLLQFDLVLESDDIKYITSMEIGQDESADFVTINSWLGVHRLAPSQNNSFSLSTRQKLENPDSCEMGEVRGLRTKSTLKLNSYGSCSCFALPTVMSQLGRSGCTDTPEDVLVVLSESGKVLFVSPPPKRGKYYMLTTDLTKDGNEEIVVAMNGWCDQMGHLKIYQVK